MGTDQTTENTFLGQFSTSPVTLLALIKQFLKSCLLDYTAMRDTFTYQFLISHSDRFMVTQYALNPLRNVVRTFGDRALASEAGRSGLESSFHLSLVGGLG